MKRICSIKGCHEKIYCKSLCNHHWQRKKNGVPMSWPKHFNKGGIKPGSENPRWNGGISQYKNAGDLRRAKKILLQNISECEICKRPAQQVHHIDQTKENHSIDNLVVLCIKCHRFIHKLSKITQSPESCKTVQIGDPEAMQGGSS